MIEVEAKVKISNPEKIKEKAKLLAKYKGRQIKIDDYYSLKTKGYPKKSLRVRKLDGEYQINFKHRLKSKSKVDSKNEVEFHVSNVKGFLALIHGFGFRRWINKEKESFIYEISKRFHIEVNHVKGLGWFAEVEYLAHPDEIDHARREVLKMIKALGLRKKDIIQTGYTKLLWDKFH
jgi:predicted adenylyl cyclase CyaB